MNSNALALCKATKACCGDRTFYVLLERTASDYDLKVLDVAARLAWQASFGFHALREKLTMEAGKDLGQQDMDRALSLGMASHDHLVFRLQSPDAGTPCLSLDMWFDAELSPVPAPAPGVETPATGQLLCIRLPPQGPVAAQQDPVVFTYANAAMLDMLLDQNSQLQDSLKLLTLQLGQLQAHALDVHEQFGRAMRHLEAEADHGLGSPGAKRPKKEATSMGRSDAPVSTAAARQQPCTSGQATQQMQEPPLSCTTSSLQQPGTLGGGFAPGSSGGPGSAALGGGGASGGAAAAASSGGSRVKFRGLGSRRGAVTRHESLVQRYDGLHERWQQLQLLLSISSLGQLQPPGPGSQQEQQQPQGVARAAATDSITAHTAPDMRVPGPQSRLLASSDEDEGMDHEAPQISRAAAKKPVAPSILGGRRQLRPPHV